MFLRLQQQIREEGLPVSMTELCLWFDLPRYTVYYQVTKGARQDLQSDQSNDRGGLPVWLPHLGAFTEHEQEYGVAAVSAHGLAGTQAPGVL